MTVPTLAVRETRPVGIRSSSRAMGGARVPLDSSAVMASGDRPTLAVEERPERGSRATRRLRREGYVPGVVYGGGDGDCTAFKVGARDLRTALVAGSAVLDLTIGGGRAVPVIVKDQQHHPVRDHVMHLDLLRVRLDEKIQSTVAVEL